jgi:hypothetical protein
VIKKNVIKFKAVETSTETTKTRGGFKTRTKLFKQFNHTDKRNLPKKVYLSKK